MRILKPTESVLDEVAHARGQLMLILTTTAWPEFRKTTYSLERRFLKRAATQAQRREIQRRFAGDRLNGALEAELGPRQFMALFDDIEKIGYSNLIDRYNIVSMVVRWAVRTGEGRSHAERTLRALQTHARRSRGDPETKRRILEAIAAKWKLLNTSE